MSLTDLFLSAFPVAASQGQLSKARLCPRRITPPLRERSAYLSSFLEFLKKFWSQNKPQVSFVSNTNM